MADSTPIEASHVVRLRFEKAALLVAVGVIALSLLVCFVAMIPQPWTKILADRVVELKDSIFDFITQLGALIGASWARGHMDNRLEKS